MKIINFKPKKSGCLIGHCDIQMEVWHNMIIRDCSVFEKDGKNFFQFPSRAYEKDGETKYYRYIFFEDKDVNFKLQERFREAFNRYNKENPIQQQELPF